MSEASELRRDSEKYLQRCREQGVAHIAKMTPEELAALKKRVEEEEKRDPEELFFDVHETVRHDHVRGEEMLNLQSENQHGNS